MYSTTLSNFLNRFFLFFVGVAIYVILPQEQFCRYRFFDEHALLEGLVRREYTDSTHLTRLLTEHSNQEHNRYATKIIITSL